jgi:hypothetical protein
LVSSGSKGVYKVAKKLMNVENEQKICNLCGCVAISKAKIPTENCPAYSSSKLGFSRWDEPV